MNQSAYCPKLRAGWTIQDEIRNQVQKEDWINHMSDPVPSIPKFKEIKVNWTIATWHAFRREISNLMGP